MDSVGYTQVFRRVYIARTLLLIPSFTALPPSPLSRLGKLCQLRAAQSDMAIKFGFSVRQQQQFSSVLRRWS